MKKSVKIVLGSLAGIGILISGLVVWQWQNIRALSMAMQHSQEEIAEQIKEEKTSIESVLKDYGLEGITDFTFEEEEAIRKGEMTLEQAMEKLEQRKEEVLPNQSNHQSQTEDKITLNANNLSEEGKEVVADTQVNTQGVDTSKERIEQAISDMYALKAKYIGELGVLERKAMSEYKDLATEQKKADGIKAIISKYMTPALSLQSQCDSEVAGVLSNLETFLKEQKESSDIVAVMKAAYEREKELKKAYYLSLVQ